MSELTKRSLLNFLASLAKTGGILLLSFVMTPLLIKYLGAKDYGAFRVLLEISAYLGLFEAGLLTVIISCMVPLVKKGDQTRLEQLLAQGVWRFGKLALWMILAGFMVIPFLSQLTSWGEADKTPLYVTFLIILSAYIFIPTYIYRGYLEAINRGYLVHTIILMQNILLTVFSVFFAWMGMGLKSQALGLIISLMAGAILSFYFAKIKIHLSKRDPTFDQQINRRQKFQVLNELAAKLCWNLDSIVIGYFIDTATVTKVFVGQRIAQIMQQQLISLGQASWASLSSLYFEEESRAHFESRFYEMTKIIAFAAVVLLVPVCALNEAFLVLWLGEDMLLDVRTLIYLASANAFFHGIFTFWSYLMTMLGKSHVITRPFWVQALVNVFASIVATKIFGGVGPLIGTLCSYILVPMFTYPYLLKKYFNLSFYRLFTGLIFPLFFGVAVVFVIFRLPITLDRLTISEFIWKGVAIFSINGSLIYLLLFNQSEKKLIIDRLKKLKKR